MCKNERNYEIDVIETAVRQVWSDIKSKSTSSESTKHIIAQVFGVYLNEVLYMLPSTGAVDYGGCDYGGFYGECDYGECEYGECEYSECEYGECDYGGCVSVRVWPMG